MAFSSAYRVLLTGLLPLIAIVFYIEGQRYDHALIRFDQSQPDSATITSLLPDRIDRFSLLGNVRLYTKDNLYEYVNGHAEYFISAGFMSLAVGEYSISNRPDTEPDVIVDVYDMGKSIQAFGVISDESGGSLSDMSNGLTGFTSPSGLTFISGQYYIKLSAYNEQIPLESIAASIAGSIGDASDPFPEFARLPDIGSVAATRFVKESYRGLDFVNNVIEREYIINDQSVYVFIITNDMGNINEITTSFIDYFNTSDIKFSTLKRGNGTIYKISDPYEGAWSMIVFPDSIVGIFGETDETILNKILKEPGS